MIKRNFKGKVFLSVKRIFRWCRCLRYREQRRLSDHRAMAKAMGLVMGGMVPTCKLSGAPLARGEG